MPETAIEIRPQAGPQEAYLSTSADIAFYGGAAFGGKTFALLLEPLRHTDNPQFGFVIFRRTYPQIENEGGLWDESEEIYIHLNAKPIRSKMEWRFPSGAKGRFHHMEHEKHKYDHKGGQYTYIGFDQLEDFTEGQFVYLISRNRSMCGVRPYMRATMNPDADSWLVDWIEWYLDDQNEYPDPEKAGVVRWFMRQEDDLVWADSREDLIDRYGEDAMPKSFTFIPASPYDNPIGLERDPGYMANLKALPRVERERLLGGNWKIKPSAGNVFDRAWFEIVRSSPVDGKRIRYWDKAGTEGGGKYTAGVLMNQHKGIYYVEDVVRGQWSSGRRNDVIKQTAELDGVGVKVWVEQEPGSGGKESAEYTIQELAGYSVRAERPTGDKVDRADPFSAQAEAGNVKLVSGDWNEAYLNELHNFPDGKFADQVDGSSGAFNQLALGVSGDLKKIKTVGSRIGREDRGGDW